MSVSAQNSTPATQVATDQSFGQKLAKLIDDPVGSVVVGTAFPMAAVMFLVGGIYGIGLIH
jgi:hypothetical protein